MQDEQAEESGPATDSGWKDELNLAEFPIAALSACVTQSMVAQFMVSLLSRSLSRARRHHSLKRFPTIIREQFAKRKSRRITRLSQSAC